MIKRVKIPSHEDYGHLTKNGAKLIEEQSTKIKICGIEGIERYRIYEIEEENLKKLEENGTRSLSSFYGITLL